MKTIIQNALERNLESDNKTLKSSDRRALLGGSLRLLNRKFRGSRPILAEDIVRVAAFADDATLLREPQ